MSQAITLAREALYGRVWATPMTGLAEELGLTIRGLRKLCEKHEIPTPSPGHWTRLKLGKAVDPEPLPPASSPRLRTIRIVPRSAYNTAWARRRIEDPDLVKLLERERDPRHKIQVPQELANPHPIILRTRERLADTRTTVQDSTANIRARQECADIEVTSGQVPRALRLTNALFRALEARGFGVAITPEKDANHPYRSRVRCTVLGVKFGIRLVEKHRKVSLTDEGRRRLIPVPELGPKIRWEPNGVFQITLLDEGRSEGQSWRDDRGGMLEGRLNEVVIGMLVEIQRGRRVEVGRAREAERQEVARREREGQERIRQLEQARVSHLLGAAEDLGKVRRLRAYVEAVRQEAIRRHGSLDDVPGVSRWLEWAEGQVRSIDPLGPDSPLPRIDAPGDLPPSADMARAVLKQNRDRHGYG